MDPWDWYVYLHEWLIFYGKCNVGKYIINPTNAMKVQTKFSCKNIYLLRVFAVHGWVFVFVFGGKQWTGPKSSTCSSGANSAIKDVSNAGGQVVKVSDNPRAYRDPMVFGGSSHLPGGDCNLGGQKSQHSCLAILCDLFVMVNFHDPFKGCWWPPTFGDQVGSRLESVINNHGYSSFRPLRIGLWDPL